MLYLRVILWNSRWGCIVGQSSEIVAFEHISISASTKSPARLEIQMGTHPVT